MKRVCYTEGPPTLTAGIAGLFVLGKAKPVSDKTAALLLHRPEFTEAAPDVPDMDGYEQYRVAAETADKADLDEAKAAAKKNTSGKAAPSDKEEVISHA